MIHLKKSSGIEQTVARPMTNYQLPITNYPALRLLS